MSPEEAAAQMEVMTLERQVYARLYEMETGPGLFIRIGRDEYRVPLSPLCLALLAEDATAYLARIMRRATLEEANVG
ncbi:MAG: hypothetical protein WC869_11715 [Phycisphaerae bacterium]|jgi:hypothetical protein